MKTILFLFSGLLILLHSCNTKDKKAVPQKKDYYIDMTGFDSLKLGMPKAELEAILDTTFKLKHIHVGGPYDTFSTKYKGVDIVITGQQSYLQRAIRK